MGIGCHRKQKNDPRKVASRMRLLVITINQIAYEGFMDNKYLV